MSPINLLPPHRFQRIGHKFHKVCSRILSHLGGAIEWVICDFFLIMLGLLLLPVAYLWELLLSCQRCPGCKRRGKLNVTSSTFSVRSIIQSNELHQTKQGITFYRCRSCGGRYQQQKRIWRDSSGPEFDRFFVIYAIPFF